MSDDLIERLRHTRLTTWEAIIPLVVEAADRIEELEAANRGWLDKWERMACEFCGSHMDPDRAELLDALLDTRDPLTRAGVCIFCEQRVGLSVFGSELLNPDRHSKGCAWLNRQLRGAGDE
jgi:hypothetical protein